VAGGHARKRTALILTALNEAATIDDLLASIAALTYAPDEVVVVDGGSTDATWDRLQAWCGRLPLRLLREDGALIARGRNVAIAAANAEVIAATDAGVRLEPDWLAQLMDALSDDVDVVSGFFAADVETTFEKAMGATVLPALADIDARTFLPSSRSVLFRKAAWHRAGGYPEDLDYCEDLVFDLKLKRQGSQFAFAPRAVAHYRPRSSLRAFFRQYYLYARGDGKADLWRARHAIRYATYMAMLALMRRGGWAWLLLLAGGLAYTRRPLQRLDVSSMTMRQAAYAVALVPVIRLVGDVAKMLGYPVGVVWRLCNR
jgi:glycosyltransferase involved in cell wall biosynthesis